MRKRYLTVTAGLTVSAVLWGISSSQAQSVLPPPLAPNVDYSVPNFANSPILTKFTNSLPGLGAAGANDLGQYIPVAVPMGNLTPAGVPRDGDYYEIAVVDYLQQMHSELPPTKLRGYVQIYPPGTTPQPAGSVVLMDVTNNPILVNGVQVYAYDKPRYLGPTIFSQKGTPTRIKFWNLLPAGTAGDLFIPTDVTVMGAGMGPDMSMYTKNRASLHLHGGDNPWVSDGTAHQWITPAGETATLKKGVSQQNVSDMPIPANGSATFYWPNGQSGRLMFYHDHSLGMTRLDVYAGEAAGYLLEDPTERSLNAYAPGGEIPLIIQDKTFVNDGTVPPPAKFTGVPTAATGAVDPLWTNQVLNPNNWGQTHGSLWFPHVYMPNQNPNDLSGANMLGRWDYGAWFWPVFPSGIPPTTSIVPEAFMDTPVINGTAYPYLKVQPNTYRFRVLNACNDRYLNLQFYIASPIVSSITVQTPGSGYIDPPLVTITPAAGDTTGKGATAEAVVNPVTGGITAINLLTVGSGYTLPPTVTIAPPPSGTQAIAAANVYTNLTEVGMVPASKTAGIAFPALWTAYDTPGMIPNILDDRAGGVPDPANIGPSFIQIGSEGGIAPQAVALQNTPIGFEQNKRSVTVLNTFNHTLFLGPAERADVVVDFSNFAGKTLIVYNDAPAPVPAGDPRYDYYTCDPDNTMQGGAPSTAAGYGPNMRTIMQIQVAAATPAPALNPAALNAAVASAFSATQPAAIVPGGTYARIADTSLNVNGTTMPLQPKTIQELFDPLGRMNSTLGVEIPFTTATIQTTIPYGFADPATEVIPDGATQLWKITHNGVDTHAIHFHLFNVQVVNRVGWDGAIKPPWPEELGWKETVKMNPLEDIIVALRAKTPTVPFTQPDNIRYLDATAMPGDTTPFLGVGPDGNPVTVSNILANFGQEYTWHCHLLGHEENDMMRPIMVAVPPPAPTSLAAAVTSTKKGSTTTYQVKLTWKNNATLAQGFTIQRAANAAFNNALYTFSVGNVTSFVDTTVNPFVTPYYYRVAAVSVVGSGVAGFPSVTNSSAWSSVLGPPVGAVTAKVGQATPAKSPVVISWTYFPPGDQTGFVVQRAVNSSFTSGLTTFNINSATATSYSDTTAKAGTTYYYRVQAVNALGNGTWYGTTPASITPHP